MLREILKTFGATIALLGISSLLWEAVFSWWGFVRRMELPMIVDMVLSQAPIALGTAVLCGVLLGKGRGREQRGGQ